MARSKFRSVLFLAVSFLVCLSVSVSAEETDIKSVSGGGGDDGGGRNAKEILHKEGPHIRNLGYSGSIPEPRISLAQSKSINSQRKPSSKGETCEDAESCAKLSQSSSRRLSKARSEFRSTGGTMGKDPVHPGPLKIEVRNLNLRPIKNSTSTETGRSDGEARTMLMSASFSTIVLFLFKALCSFIFVKSIEWGWNAFWKFAAWGQDSATTTITIGGAHPFAHYSTGWNTGGGSGWGSHFGGSPNSFSNHYSSLHRPTGNIYYPGNKYYAGSHADVKALKKAAKHKKKSYKKSKYHLGPLVHHDPYDGWERSARISNSFRKSQSKVEETQTTPDKKEQPQLVTK